MPDISAILLTSVFQLSRSGVYYESRKKHKDLELRDQILAVLATNPSYGHRRISIALHLGKRRVRRVMNLYQILPYKRKARWRKRRDERRAPEPFQNEIKNQWPIQPNHIWVSDFTYLKHQTKFLYLATVMDLFTREIVGWHISSKHTKELVMGALADAVMQQKLHTPSFVHSDQGVEYAAADYTNFAKHCGIQISMSKKASPWENGYQESFFNNFKTDLGLEFDRYTSTGELVEAIHQTIRYYNQSRIHTTLKMSPSQFRYQTSLRKSV